jgi:hypothetical protein
MRTCAQNVVRERLECKLPILQQQVCWEAVERSPGPDCFGAPMKRRHFLRAATASVLFPAALRQSRVALAGAARKWDYVFFDERFEIARLLAASGSASNRSIGVRGDITPFWTIELDGMTGNRPLHLCGVTAQSICFCLKILLGERAHLDVQAARLNRDLLLWTMRTTPKTQYGTTS